MHSLCPAILGQCLLLQVWAPTQNLGLYIKLLGNPTVEPLIRFNIRGGSHLGWDNGGGAMTQPNKSSQKYSSQFPKSEHLILNAGESFIRFLEAYLEFPWRNLEEWASQLAF